MAYLDNTDFALLTIAPAERVDEVETVAAGWLAATLGYWSSWIDARLGKRYAVPFQAPYPVAVSGWLARIVTRQLYLKLGVDPSDQQFTSIDSDAKDAMAEIKEAAEAKDGLFELPLRADATAQGVTRGTPLGYSETSPYRWTTIQADAAHEEDSL